MQAAASFTEALIEANQAALAYPRFAQEMEKYGYDWEPYYG